MTKASVLVEFVGSYGEDRAHFGKAGDVDIIIIADGAGGTSGGEEAAEAVVSMLKEHFSMHEAPSDPMELEKLFRGIDLKLRLDPVAGESTGILVILTERYFLGVSAGDSEAWLFSDEFDLELTKFQSRKPLLGTGKAVPVGFGPYERMGKLLVGSDGVFDFLEAPEIRKIVTTEPTEDAPKTLLRQIRLSNGELPDDFAAVVLSLT